MNERHKVTFAIVSIPACALLTLSSCEPKSQPVELSATEMKAAARLSSANNTVTLTPAYDVYFERGVDDHCYTKECDTSYYSFHDTCEYLRLQQWDASSECARAHVVLDFRTDLLSLPQGAQVTGIDNATLQMYVNDAYGDYLTTQPEPPGCFSPSLPPYPQATPAMAYGLLAWWALDADSVGVFGDAPVVEDQQCSMSGTYLDGNQPYVMPSSPGTWLTENVTAGFSTTTATRYIFDYDSGPSGFFRIVEFISMEHPSGATLGPRLNIDVDYTVPHAACLDGQIEHTATNCSSCSTQYFSTNTTSTLAAVKHSEADTPYCGDSHVVFAFDTSGLIDSHTESSAELRFFMKYDVTWAVQQSRVRVFAAQQAGTCPTALVPADFVNCTTGYLDLGTHPITSGVNTFTISNASSVINPAGITKLVLVDASTYSDPSGSVQFFIHTTETPATTKDPRLSVAYD